MSVEIVLGRTLAVCVHPFAAWRRLGTPGRLLIVTVYFSAAYIALLAILTFRFG